MGYQGNALYCCLFVSAFYKKGAGGEDTGSKKKSLGRGASLWVYMWDCFHNDGCLVFLFLLRYPPDVLPASTPFCFFFVFYCLYLLCFVSVTFLFFFLFDTSTSDTYGLCCF